MKSMPAKKDSTSRSGAFSVLVGHYVIFILLHTIFLVLYLLHVYVFCALQGDPGNDGRTDPK